MALQVDIVSSEGEIYSGIAKAVVVPATEGELGIHVGHVPLLTQLVPGSVRVIPEQGEEQYFYVSSGYLEVQPHRVTVLTDHALRASDLDEHAILKAKTHAEEAMKNRTTEFDLTAVEIALSESIAQLQTIDRYRQGRH